MLHPPGFYYVKKSKRFVILSSDKSSERNLSCFFDIIKPRRMEHLQSEEPFSSDPYFRRSLQMRSKGAYLRTLLNRLLVQQGKKVSRWPGLFFWQMGWVCLLSLSLPLLFCMCGLYYVVHCTTGTFINIKFTEYSQTRCTANIFKVIFTVFNCVRLSTVVSLYGLHLIAAPSTIK